MSVNQSERLTEDQRHSAFLAAQYRTLDYARRGLDYGAKTHDTAAAHCYALANTWANVTNALRRDGA